MKKILFLLLLTATSAGQAFATSEPFRHGRLDNGLHYYIRANRTTPGKADFYLVQNVGALMEEDHQNGLAHVLEHMAFHATENFPEGAPAFLKRRGIQDLNAYTGADETVYHIDGVPTDDKGLVDSCILILHDWSGFLLLRADEMEIERKVILEERRQGMDLSQRMQTKLNALLYNHSKYATHDVIGTPEVLNHFTAEEVHAYYRDFYRPDQQAVIIIGDIEPEAVEAEVKRLFAPIPKRINPKARLTYHIPDNTEPLYCRLIDKDIPQNAIVLMQRFRKAPVNSLETQIKEQLCSEFYNQLVSSYLNDFIQEEDANFLSAQAGVHNMVRHYEGQNIAVTPLPGMEKEALRQVLEQLERIRRYGITEQKMKELTDNYRRSLRQSAAMLNRMPNSVYLKIYQDHFLLGYPLCEVAAKLDSTYRIVGTIDSTAMQEWIARWYNQANNWIYAVQGNNPDYPFPDSRELTAIRQEARNHNPQPYSESKEEILPPLMDFEPQSGTIVKTKILKNAEAEEWTLNNGAKVYYKYTDSEAGIFNLLAGSAGGRSLLPAEDLPSADALNALFLQHGLYKHTPKTLNAIMQGHEIDINIALDERSESINCRSTHKDAERALQFFHLTVTHPRFSRPAFNKYVRANKIQRAYAKPTTDDSIAAVMKEVHALPSPRIHADDTAYYAAMNFERMQSIYDERFRNAGDFSFYLVGDLPREEARRLTELYIASLPTKGTREKAVLHNYERHESATRDIVLGLPEEKYMVNIEFKNRLPIKPADKIYIQVLRQYLEQRYHQTIREDAGGSYGVHLLAQAEDYPQNEQTLVVQFESSRAKGAQMRQIVHEEIKRLQEEGVPEDDVEYLALVLKKAHNTAFADKDIAYWTENLQFYNRTRTLLDDARYFDNLIDKITAKEVTAFARKFFRTAQCIDIVVY